MMRGLLITGCTGFLLSTGCAHQAASTPVPTPALTPEATGRGGAAATIDSRATAAAIEILKDGGNAVDAAVAAAGVLGVTDPYSCGIGGGGFMLIYLADEKRVVSVEHREKAPRELARSLYYEAGAPIPFPEVMSSGLSTGVPGMVRGWEAALTRYGTRGLSEVLQPGIRVAERGFEVDQTFVDQTARNAERFKLFSSTAALFLPAQGQPAPVGSTFKNPDMGKTYRLVAEGGSRAFYRGEIAQAIVNTVAQPPVAPGAPKAVRAGVLKLADMADYEVRIREPVKSTYRGLTVYGMNAPSSGGVAVGLALGVLEGYEPASMSRADYLHHYIEASRLAFADRNAYVGDPEFVEVPVTGLLSKEYAAERRKALSAQPVSVPRGSEHHPAGGAAAADAEPGGVAALGAGRAQPGDDAHQHHGQAGQHRGVHVHDRGGGRQRHRGAGVRLLAEQRADGLRHPADAGGAARERARAGQAAAQQHEPDAGVQGRGAHAGAGQSGRQHHHHHGAADAGQPRGLRDAAAGGGGGAAHLSAQPA